MAEQEVIKHTKKVYKIWNSKEHTFWHKFKEFAIEILIIVFAVTLSIKLHSWTEHRHEQKQVKTFLLGLKTDIQQDIEEVNSLVAIYKNYSSNYQYLSNLNVTSNFKNDTLSGVLNSITSNAYLRPNMSRYTGFSTSGKLLNIENEKLTQNILNLYQELVPRIKSSEGGYIERHTKLLDYLYDNMTERNSEESKLKVLLTPKGRNFCEQLIPGDQLFKRYNDFIKSGKEIIQQIDEEYQSH